VVRNGYGVRGDVREAGAVDVVVGVEVGVVTPAMSMTK
jgi:hypothetical protein